MPGVLKAQRPRRILLVEDNEDIRFPLGKLLAAAGHEIAAARDGEEALRLAEGFRPEVAIVDIGLPGMDGYQLAQRLSGTALIALSGYAGPADVARSISQGFRAHLIKPFELDALLEAIDRV